MNRPSSVSIASWISQLVATLVAVALVVGRTASDHLGAQPQRMVSA